MEVFLGAVHLLVAAALALAAGQLMSPRGPGRRVSRHQDGRRGDDAAIRGLSLTWLAVAAGTTGAAWLSTGEVSVRGLSPFVVAVVLVLGPVAVTARRRGGAGSVPHARATAQDPADGPAGQG
ncbi:hypothetical protein GCU56_01615 [Geodermatophilus sabuli]|uniref:Uncharacterized protein n=1 Tax=Geodermatophilus sabuli TaxID=1564158 RepID=A0A7K3VVF7_9ACTN|nr:hypothetical protein [Geodermatophilus sabuli]NEK56572.1 hypothetical protein [Geodermatophilus sabuli]